MNTKLEVIRLANEDVISTSGLICDGKGHAYMSNVSCNGYDDKYHPVVRYFTKDGNIISDECVYNSEFTYEQRQNVGWYYGDIQSGWSKCEIDHNFDITNIHSDCNYES